MTTPLSARPDLSCRGFDYDVLMMIKTAIIFNSYDENCETF